MKNNSHNAKHFNIINNKLKREKKKKSIRSDKYCIWQRRRKADVHRQIYSSFVHRSYTLNLFFYTSEHFIFPLIFFTRRDKNYNYNTLAIIQKIHFFFVVVSFDINILFTEDAILDLWLHLQRRLELSPAPAVYIRGSFN